MRELTITLILSLFLAHTANASECVFEPHRKAPAGFEELLGQVFKESSVLSGSLYHYSNTTISDANEKLKELRLKLRQLKSKIESGLPLRMLSGSLTTYSVGLINLAQSELYLTGKTDLLKDENYIQIPTQDFLSASHTTDNPVSGTESVVNGPVTTVRPSLFNRQRAWLNYLAKSKPMQKNGRAYFETSKCLLSRLYIEKINVIAASLSEDSNLDLSTAGKACGEMTYEELAGNAYATTLGLRQYRLYEADDAIQNVFQFISEEEVEHWEDIRTSNNFSDLDLAIFTTESEDSISQELDNFMSRAEQELLTADPIVKLVSNAALAGFYKASRQNPSCTPPHAEKAIRRLVALNTDGTLKNSSALRFTESKELLTQNLKEALVAQALSSIDYAIVNGSTINSILNVDEAEAYKDNVRRLAEQEVRKLIETSEEVERLSKRLKAPQDTEPVKALTEALVETALKMEKVTDPKTPLSELPYESRYIVKLFEGLLSELNPQHSQYMNQVITRSNFEEQAKAWERYSSEIQLDQEAKGYECIERGMWGSFKAWVTSTPHTDTSKSCALLKRLVSHLGLEKKNEPKSLADVWDSFKNNEAYSKSDLESFEKNYREFLKAQEADNFRLLDTPLEKLGTHDLPIKKGHVFNVVANYPTEAFTVSLMERAIRFVKANNELELLVIQNSQNIEDLHPYIKDSMVLNNLLGMKEVDSYSPDLSGILGNDKLFAYVYDVHNQYQDELIRKTQLEKTLNDEFIDRLEMPIWIFGGLALGRLILLRAPGTAAAGSAIQVGADSTRLMYQGYTSGLAMVFAAGFANASVWHYDLSAQMNRLDELRYNDWLSAPEDIKIVSYDAYMARRNGIENHKYDAKVQMGIYGTFTALSAVGSVLGPILQARSAAGLRTSPNWKWTKKLSESWQKVIYWTRQGARTDKKRLTNYMKTLGNPSSYHVKTLKNAAQRIGTPAADTAYKRIIHRLGQRIRSSSGNKQRLEVIAKEYFGNKNSQKALEEILEEFNKLAPDLVKGAI